MDDEEEKVGKRLVGSRWATGCVSISMKKMAQIVTQTHTQLEVSSLPQRALSIFKCGLTVSLVLRLFLCLQSGQGIGRKTPDVFLRLYFQHSDNQTLFLSKFL